MFVKPLNGYSLQDYRKIRFYYELRESENNGMLIQEMGLLTSVGTLFARILWDEMWDEPIRKTSEFSLDGNWTLEF
jgi:hypothetical protein